MLILPFNIYHRLPWKRRDEYKADTNLVSVVSYFREKKRITLAKNLYIKQLTEYAASLMSWQLFSENRLWKENKFNEYS